uniref:Uncharacterized protein n=1 Tax=Arundo donax TaxID=35708 RepID=A0A0A8XU47_ARUDO
MRKTPSISSNFYICNYHGRWYLLLRVRAIPVLPNCKCNQLGLPLSRNPRSNLINQ